MMEAQWTRKKRSYRKHVLSNNAIGTDLTDI
jgi:hypothetical protein